MPSKPFPWSKSNRSQASVGSLTDQLPALALSQEQYNQYRPPEEQQRYYTPQQQDLHPRPQGPHPPSILSLDRPPVNVAASVHADVPAPIERPPHEQQYPYIPQAHASDFGHQGPEAKKSLRSRLGFGTSSRDSFDSIRGAPTSRGLGRRVSVRKEVGSAPSRPQAPEEQHRQQWSRQNSIQSLPISHEAEEHAHPEPYLHAQHDKRPIAAQSQEFTTPQYHRPSLPRVNTSQTYHLRDSGVSYSPQHHSGGASNFAEHPPPYQPYTPHSEHPPQEVSYRPYKPESAGSANSRPSLSRQHTGLTAEQEFQPKQQEIRSQNPSIRSTPDEHRQQPEVDYFFRERASRQQSYQSQHLPPQPQPQNPPPQLVRVPVQQQAQQAPQQQEPERLQALQTPQSAQPSLAPATPQSSRLDPPTQQEIVITPLSDNSPQIGSGEMPSTSAPPNKRPADANKQGGQQPQQQGQEGPRTPGIQTFGANVVPQTAQGQPSRGSRQQSVANESDKGRATPPPARAVGDMSEDEVVQLVKDHEVLREKYQKVKRYFFEQQSQVHQLQDTLAHQRLSQSRTSLDDSEYNARFERLHGLVGQLAFNIRKDWSSIPPFLQPAVNKDALTIGKQEMTAVGKALILSWLMEELFDKHFHPDLDPALSIQLKHIQTNIRRTAPFPQSAEEEEALTSKLVSWRLATLDGLTDHLRDPSALQNREHLTTALKESLATHLTTYLADPPPLELTSSVPMIVELAVAIASHLPMESRDVAIDYFPPGHALLGELMKVEQLQVPPLERPIADGLFPAPAHGHSPVDAAEEAATATAGKTEAESKDGQAAEKPRSGRGMLAGLIGGVAGVGGGGGGGAGGGGGGGGGGSKKAEQQAAQQQQQQQQQNVGQGGSTVSLSGSASLGAEERPPRVRMAAGFAVQIRGKNVLVKAQVVPTN